MRSPLSIIDKVILQIDLVVKSLAGGMSSHSRLSPAENLDKSILTSQESQQSVKLMRVNHSGEVCAQALYQGQALTARSSHVEKSMNQASQEESDHLAWCESRIKQLHGHTSYLNPVFYTASFTTGMVAGIIGDRINLGFLAATEDLVCEHLDTYIDRLPESDLQSRAILSQIKLDERRHANNAREAGAIEFAPGVKQMMKLGSRLMTAATYRL